MTEEVLKQMYQLLLTEPHAPTVCAQLERIAREALAQPEQEPVAWWNNTGTHIDLNVSGRGTPLYTHTPQRTWVGLTKQQQLDIFAQSVAKKRSEHEHYMAIEQALKERNQ